MNAIAQLQEALRLTESMLSAVENEKWSEISGLVHKRGQILAEVFPLDNSVNQSEASPVIEKIIQINQTIERHCVDARQSIQVELSQFNKNKKVAAAYQSS
ncbi:hypothetical protein GCM10007891_29310 [Methylophaga thalassica]|uniref:Flagellar protein FliT n=1 Tax=Methylophaga thalassica TaxID=40223 RepID=A0ABQ5TZ19_9GAMM|nr:flagellar protein FliT [Methylophaga thalassica]GLQ01078.1 hypothetical protein GCM10007891_29310 [Methylophaga thalassica]